MIVVAFVILVGALGGAIWFVLEDDVRRRPL